MISCNEDWPRGLGWRMFRFEISKHIKDAEPGRYGVRGVHYRGFKFWMSVWVPFHVEQWR